ncbi:beta-galactosidase-like [Bolinopsis microptera]|uniref:beta-galactosidase-like n=1 Tax=Bolinopsis microptera TaxID=2820187 RepID=UPI0030791DD9
MFSTRIPAKAGCLLLIGFLGICVILLTKTFSYQGFSVDYKKNVFTKDGKTFDFVSGSLHYFRVPHQLWHDRLLKLRASGINVVSTYIPWNFHEPHPSQYNFVGDADLFKFIEIAQSLGLFVNIRPGPYICSEWDLGGIPYFVLGSKKDGVQMRTMDSRYLSHVECYFNELLPRLKPYLYENGGPIILVQVENEYGSYKACDFDYMTYITKLMRKHLGETAILYTADGWDMHHLICGPIHHSDVLTTINFGPNSDHESAFHRMRSFQGNGPLVNSEFYPGWLDHWGEPHQCKSSNLVRTEFTKMLKSAMGNVFVNFYMFFGGTNFAFYNGANMAFEPKYQPDPTSYDYDAPMTESGDTTQKYYAIRNAIKESRPHLIDEHLLSKVVNSTKQGYGRVKFHEILKYPGIKSLATKQLNNVPLFTFEELQQDYGFVLYEKTYSNFYHNAELEIPEPRDMVYVFADDKYIGKIYRSENKNLTLPSFTKLGLLVENMGRINYGPFLHDYKGIVGAIKLGQDDVSKGADWNIWSLPLNNTELAQFETIKIQPGPGSILRGEFTIHGKPADTWVKMSKFGKGVIFINGRNLGRYWPIKGPQKNLYVPSVFLNTGINEMVLLELVQMPSEKDLYVELVGYPDVGSCN